MMSTEQVDRFWDVVIVGGGAAGLSAALTLARARRDVMLVDAGAPRNAPAAAAHGLIGLDGINPLELLERGRSEAASYGAHIVDTNVTSASASGDGGFSVRLDDGSTIQTGQLILATGPMSVMKALLFRQLSERISFLSNGIQFPDDQLDQLTAAGISTIQGEVDSVVITDDRLTGVQLHDAGEVSLDALAVPTSTPARLDGLRDVSVEVEKKRWGHP